MAVLLGKHASGQRRLAELERLFDAIRSAPINVVDGLVGDIRAYQSRAGSRALQHSDFADHDDSGTFSKPLSPSFLLLVCTMSTCPGDTNRA